MPVSLCTSVAKEPKREVGVYMREGQMHLGRVEPRLELDWTGVPCELGYSSHPLVPLSVEEEREVEQTTRITATQNNTIPFCMPMQNTKSRQNI